MAKSLVSLPKFTNDKSRDGIAGTFPDNEEQTITTSIERRKVRQDKAVYRITFLAERLGRERRGAVVCDC